VSELLKWKDRDAVQDELLYKSETRKQNKKMKEWEKRKEGRDRYASRRTSSRPVAISDHSSRTKRGPRKQAAFP